MRKLWLAALVVSLGCASAPIKPPDLSELEKADALVLQGCYDCLLEARDIYARVGVAKARPFVVSRLFEAELLITLREKELAIDAAASLARAQALVPELPPSLDAARSLALVAAVPSDDVGTPRRDDVAFRRERGAFIATVESEIAWLRSATAELRCPRARVPAGHRGPKPAPPGAPVIPTRLGQTVREYLALSVDCMYPTRPRGAGQPTRPVRRRRPRPAHRRSSSTAPRFAAASRSLRLKRCAPPSRGSSRRLTSSAARASATRATTAVPSRRSSSPRPMGGFRIRRPSRIMRGNINQLVGDCREALRYYEETLKLRPLHENGWLGQTVCLTYLKRTDDAIASATRMVELKLDNTSDALLLARLEPLLRA